MRTSSAWITYTVVRLLAFAIPFIVIMLVLPAWQWNWLTGLIAGTVISLAVSEIFLRKQKIAIGEAIEQRRAGRADRDRRPAVDIEEDADLDADLSAESDANSTER
ncbi:DUF4229 domain-containing protein [Gulosibacter macacae]|uniref:DUF4229 domain-containing protein n=1 Tax=Gulosibacter macacae TaxID=2488791 RepID=A0A3P3VVJ4_9MICO|nr:DUF4229 domain-containing protein [Gulosibacter macacae]RRJ86018.1 DUF4229 domain-containing protein [Gulosibacter macacae]